MVERKHRSAGVKEHITRKAEDLKNSPYSVWGRPVNVGASGQEVMPVPEGYERLNIAGATRQRGRVREQMYVPHDMAYALNQFKDLGLKRSCGYCRCCAAGKEYPDGHEAQLRSDAQRCVGQSG
jgi:hypothetical protein